MTFKCKICGGQTTLDSQSGIVICEYCGTKQALPLFTEESERLLYEKGNSYLSQSEYDKAENIFTQLLTIKPNAAELYWDLVLCRYGVTYVKDPKTDKYIPTCNRTHYTPIFSDENYKKAIELSDGEKKDIFEQDASIIDNIQKGIIAVSKKEKPFDIFISYKETDANGNRTKDSVEAQKLYEKLTEEGYKVFFSRITLEDKIGTEYEPYIYSALYSSKVMLTVCSSKENLEAVWVKNEWSRFLGFRQIDNSKTLLPICFNMDKAELPDELALLPAYDMAVDGFIEELLRGIKKLIPLPIMKAKRRKQIRKTVGITLGVVAIIIGLVAAILIPKELERKRIEAENTAKENAYQSALTLFDNADYTAAQEAFVALGSYKDSALMAEKCPIQSEYDAAKKLYYDGKYAESVWAFDALGDYEDAAEQKAVAEKAWRNSLVSVVADNGYNSHVDTYYITPNGTIADYFTGKEEAGFNEHGKIVSISNGSSNVLTLYEDGTINNNINIQSSSEKWDGVIQIVNSDWDLGDIALRSDGTVSIENPDTDYDYINDSFADAKNWKDIVMLSGATDSGGNADFSIALAALDAKGNVYLCYRDGWYDENKYYGLKTFIDESDAFENIKMIDISMGYSFGEMYYDTDYYVNAVALTKDGYLVSYINGIENVYVAEDIIDVGLGTYDETIYALSSDGKLYDFERDTLILNDVVKICDDYAVTRSGAMYSLNGSNCELKTQVLDEWSARMG